MKKGLILITFAWAVEVVGVVAALVTAIVTIGQVTHRWSHENSYYPCPPYQPRMGRFTGR
jgi:hypothetical protein